MEQGPEELSHHPDERANDLDRLTREPIDSGSQGRGDEGKGDDEGESTRDLEDIDPGL